MNPILPSYLQQQYYNDPRLQMATALQQQGMSTAPVQSWTQGLARIAQGLVGGLNQQHLRGEYQQQGQQYSSDLANALAGPDVLGSLSKSQNPMLQQMGLQAQVERATRAPQEMWRPMTPQDAQARGLNPKGSYETSNFGQTRVVQAPQLPQVAGGMLVDPTAGTATPIPGYDEQQRRLAVANRAPHETWTPIMGPDGKTPIGQQSNYGQINMLPTAGVFGGGDGALLNILTHGDPTSPDYRTAYSAYSQPKPSFDQASGMMTVINPDMSAFRPPAGAAQGAPSAPRPQAPVAPPPQMPQGAPQGVPQGLPTPQAPAGMQQGQLPPQTPPMALQQAPMAQGAPVGQPGGPTISVQRAAPPKPIPLTEDQSKSVQLYSIAKPDADIVLGNVTGADGKPVLDNNGQPISRFDTLNSPTQQIVGGLPIVGKGAANLIASPDQQRARNSLKNIIATYLYSSSGATANPGEVANQADILSPSFGEHGPSLADKKARIKNMVDSIRLRATAGIPPGQPIPPELWQQQEQPSRVLTFNPNTGKLE